MADYSDFPIKWELLVSDAWSDDALKKRLLSDPASVMKERGIEVPAGVTVTVHANDDSQKHFVIPSLPAEAELSEEELANVAGGHHHLSFHSLHSGGHSGGHSGHHSHHSGHHSGGHFC